MRNCLIASCLLVIMLMLDSCRTPHDITYFQDATAGTVVDPSYPLEIRVKPDDKLAILVTTQDEQITSLFNLTKSTNQTSTNSWGYTVDNQGNINFPVLGELHVAGLTRTEVSDYICKRLEESDLVKDPIVTVEYANSGISIIGEVKSPGNYEFNKDRLNIVDAIAMAGDLTLNGQRENITVIRRIEAGRQEVYRINLLDLRSAVASPVYYLQQNDIVYVEPDDKKKRESTVIGNTVYTPSFWLSIASFGMTVVTFVLALTR